MKYLICDLNIQKKGHYIGYNQFLISYQTAFAQKRPNDTVAFLYNEEARDLLSFEGIDPQHIHFTSYNTWSSKSLGEKLKLFKEVKRITEQVGADHLIFMDLDQYQIPIFATSFSFKVSGVLFRPHHRIQPSHEGWKATWSSWVQRRKKIIAEKFLTYTKQVENIFILNDEAGVEQLNRFHGSRQFRYLPDPVFSYPSSVQQTGNSTRFKFLIFGAINERKNITNIVNAFDQATFSIPVTLQIVGSSDAAYLQYLSELIASLKSLHAEKEIEVHSSFVSNEQMDVYFAQASVCLLVYKDFFGSSGLLGRASLHGKPVVGTNVGLLNELIQKYQLGIVCDPNSISSIAAALTSSCSLKLPASHFHSFYSQFSPENFADTLISPRP
ncbi:MAG: glycosyltransferase [Cytophagaceae bacterium]|jgi:glycosyltransferase involved in cell wall biosynthesis|nr:glycosyltransferase [Cytophagaceae bacterium]